MLRAAIYARYSSDNQSVASIDDQITACEEVCERRGFSVVMRASDEGISGERLDRPGYLDILNAAKAEKFDVLLLWKLNRLSRASDLVKVIETLKFYRVRVVTSGGFDSSRSSSDTEAWFECMTNNKYNKDLAADTHRGLKGRATKGKSAGGLPYGYRVTEVGERAIDEEQAEIVRLIYQRTIEGDAPRRIAAELNKKGIRTARGKLWSVSGIYGDHKKGVGILANPIYRGVMIWNRSRWVKHPETGRRLRRERPESDWIATEHPELRIISPETWSAAYAVMTANKRDTGSHGGRRPSHLLSGILRCGECGGSMTAIDRYRYGCTNAKNKGESVCSGEIRVSRSTAEDAILASVRSELLSDDAFKAFEKETRKLLSQSKPDTRGAENRRRKAEKERENVLAAIRAGIVTKSTKADLENIERSIEVIEAELAAAKQWEPAKFLPRARDLWRGYVEKLSNMKDLPEIRTALNDLLGGEIVVSRRNGAIVAQLTGCLVDLSENMVAGARFDNCLTNYVDVVIVQAPDAPRIVGAED